jgi:hypothetical protein
MWIPCKRADEPAKNALREDINARELYPLQDLINWMKKTDAKWTLDRYGQMEQKD